eukprot:CAMPEP_0201698094 /NCGR_PEP_ID=MMETSP0578-20130828/17081_1 /ASSEMBLY_ACC=CAM_ASM_000663 /TAXON_ID=267565 /ORGANISM="Skeletonema grethea, Strain CCMP 1804" /LENGTH=456 /DNA_ID=CAMNT_0048184525 /DNA_START=275 /DNA_END=1645 /DNA_ORIENTATION=+
MEQSETTAPKQGGPAERNPAETSEEPQKVGILPGILPPKMGSDSSSSSHSLPHVPPQAAVAPEHSHMPIPPSGFDPVQAMPQSGATSLPYGSSQFGRANAPQWPAAAQGILPPAAGESSVASAYTTGPGGHEQYQSLHAQYDPSTAGQAQDNWLQQMSFGHPMPTSYPLYAPPSYEIGAEYGGVPVGPAAGRYQYGPNANVQQGQTAYPQLYDPSYQMRQNQRLAAAGYGHYTRNQMQDQGDNDPYRNRGRGDRGGMRRGRSENPDSAKDPGPPIGNHLRGPEGANLFVFHIPNTMTNQDLYSLFSQHGNVLSATIKTEAKTGRGRGFGFVNYDSADSASRAIHHLNGASINGKHLKVQHKRVESQFPTQEFSGGGSYPTQDYAGGGSYPMHEYSAPYPTQQYQQGYESHGTATTEPSNEGSRPTPLLPPLNTSNTRSDDDTKPAAEKSAAEESQS